MRNPFEHLCKVGVYQVIHDEIHEKRDLWNRNSLNQIRVYAALIYTQQIITGRIVLQELFPGSALEHVSSCRPGNPAFQKLLKSEHSNFQILSKRSTSSFTCTAQMPRGFLFTFRVPSGRFRVALKASPPRLKFCLSKWNLY